MNKLINLLAIPLIWFTFPETARFCSFLHIRLSKTEAINTYHVYMHLYKIQSTDQVLEMHDYKL